jgi:hypothetical protein
MNTDLYEKSYREGLSAIADEYPDFEVAARAFKRAADHATDRWEPLYARAWCLLKLAEEDGNTPETLSEVQQLLERVITIAGPICPDAMAQLALIYARADKYEAAVDLAFRAVGRISQLPSDGDGERVNGWFDEVLVEGLCSLLDKLDESPPDQTGLDLCTKLETGLRAVGMPASVERSLLSEVLATRCELLRRLDRRAELNGARASLSALSSDHPALSAAHFGSSGSRDLPPNFTVSFENVGGADVPGTFQNKIKNLFDSFFGDGDVTEVRARAESLGDQLLRTVLMFGPSGCGKTFIVRSIIGEYRRRFGRELLLHEVKLNEVFSKWVGDGERALSSLFDRAIKSQPCLLFIDEVDAIGGSRDTGQDWRAMQTSHLLQEIDRLRQSNSMILLIGATNRIWEVELALMRRFDHYIPVEMPNRNVRREIFRAQIREIAEPLRPESPDYDVLADRSHGLTPGDIANVMRRAKDRLRGPRGAVRRLTMEDVTVALGEIGRPLHVRNWVRSAVDGLERADLKQQAEELLEQYAGYLDQPISMLAERTQHVPPLPHEAYFDTPSFDLALVRHLRTVRQ